MNDSNAQWGTSIVGSSSVIKELHRSLEKVAPLPLPVLLTGESGTGKELVAKEIHRRSAREPLITVDCTGNNSDIFISELFGHERGSFTGAIERRTGLVKMAEMGTLFLDEIGELDLRIQARLLRFIQGHEYRPVGSNSVFRSACRIVAATNRDLSKEVSAGRFRFDLYQRLSVLELSIPPLRARDGDISTLFEYFQRKHSLSITFSRDAFRTFEAYDWPGNVRQFENLLLRLNAFWPNSTISATQLPSEITHSVFSHEIQSLATALRPAPSYTSDDGPSRFTELDHAITSKILEVLRRENGNRDATAKTLGIGRTTLYRKLKRMEEDGLDVGRGAFCSAR